MTNDLITLSAELAKAHLMQNRMSHRDVPAFLRDIHSTLTDLQNAGSGAAKGSVAAPVALAAPTPDAQSETPEAPEAQTAPAAPEAAVDDVRETGPQRSAPVLHEDISDPAYAGLDPWLAKRINPKMASKLNPKNKIHPSVFPDHLICLEDGQPVKLLRAYVQKRFGLTFNEYLDKWNLPDDYPTAPPKYLEAKRAAAKASGLGVTTRAHRERGTATTAPKAKSTAKPKASGPTARAVKATGKAASAPAASAPAPRAARGRRRETSLMPS